MDEFEAVRRFRSDIPAPDRAQLAGIGQRLFDEMYERPHRRFGWKVSSVAAAVAVTAAATLTALPGKTDDRTVATPAPVAERWVYQKIRWDTWQCGSGASTQGPSEVVSFNLGSLTQPCRAAAAEQVEQERWVRYDGGAFATADDSTTDPDDVDLWDGHYQSAWQILPPQPSDALVATLPDDPGMALRTIREHSPPGRHAEARHVTRQQRDFAEVVEILASSSHVPATKAKVIYEVLHTLAGSAQLPLVMDGEGRPAIAVEARGAYRDYTNERNAMQVLLDPETYAYRGVRYVAGIDYRVGGQASSGPWVKKGTVVATATRVITKVVGSPGQRT
ncbi:hypothetical protein [Streptomyces lavendulocolor]|uniref:hypothetical protein n=1 Tax=Streptomyces lavendulocolor TaxID=67316 RepID=UPI003C2AF15F